MQKHRISGFTLTELLVAVAIAAVVYGVGFPFGKKVFNRVYVFCDTTKLQHLVAEYLVATTLPDLTNVKSMTDFAVAWAKAGGPNEVSAYQSVKRKNKQHKKILINGKPNPDLKEEDFDFIFVNPKCGGVDGTPLFYTRGLRSDGTWSKDSLYGGTAGGIVAFEDGVQRMTRVSRDTLRVMRYRNGGHSPIFLPVTDGKVPEKH